MKNKFFTRGIAILPRFQYHMLFHGANRIIDISFFRAREFFPRAILAFYNGLYVVYINVLFYQTENFSYALAKSGRIRYNIRV